MTRIVVIPDTQVKEGVDLKHLLWAGKYIAEKKPDVIVHIGDHWDMPSLSSYDKGRKSFEGRRYTKDIESGNLAMDLLLQPIKKEIKRLKRNKKKQWNPRMVFTLGNHEDRINRAIDADAILEGVIGTDDFNLSDWEVIPFLQPEFIEGVGFCHYFTSGVMGRPVSSAKAMITKKMQSTVMGHVQDRDIAYARKADGTSVTGIFAGIFYQHEEYYLGSQGNSSWRGIWMLNDVQDGSFDELPISMNYLERKYG
tara:strand:+ start:1204 stop:1962 length:759 start_codon:yes stop_codon:yes gene_type:complete